jgi:uncharacterized protein YndB with AHSA1/START domain
MVDITVATTINRPVGEVFAYVADTTNDPAWHTDVQEVVRLAEGPVRTGMSYRIRIKPFMGVSEGTVEVIALEPNRRQVLRSEMGAMKPTITYLLEPAGGATTFTRRVQIELRGPMRLMQPLMRAIGRKRNAAFVANLKRVLEQQQPVAAR